MLSDRLAGPDRLPIPSLLALGAVHQHLLSTKQRTRAAVFVEAGDAREVHDMALLCSAADGLRRRRRLPLGRVWRVRAHERGRACARQGGRRARRRTGVFLCTLFPFALNIIRPPGRRCRTLPWAAGVKIGNVACAGPGDVPQLAREGHAQGHVEDGNLDAPGARAVWGDFTPKNGLSPAPPVSCDAAQRWCRGAVRDSATRYTRRERVSVASSTQKDGPLFLRASGRFPSRTRARRSSRRLGSTTRCCFAAPVQ